MRKVITVLIVIFMILSVAIAETETVWILCDPESYVCIRSRPRKSSQAIGGTVCGWMLETDGKEKNGFVHVVDLAAEEDNGWISNMYVVYEEPKQMRQQSLLRKLNPVLDG